MKLLLNPPGKALNKALLKQKPFREEFDIFVREIKTLLNSVNPAESEEHNKDFVRVFLRNTFYGQNLVNTKGRTDLAIYLGSSAASKAGVLIEVKHPGNLSEMITKENLNAKAMHEAMLYYFRERLDEKNDEIKHIIITNLYEWFIFDALTFENIFFKNTQLKNNYEKWNNKLKVSGNTSHFYDEIAADHLTRSDKEIEFTYFDLREYINSSGNTEKKLALLYRLFSPEHLLKKQYANDSNTLNRPFYQELLHIIGLEEVKDGGKKVIRRKVENDRSSGSLLENTIGKLIAKDVPAYFKEASKYGETRDEKLFNIALELNITWINRILFLKLLEAQLITYHKGNRNYKFLDPAIINEYDVLHELFHEVLAQKPENRGDILKYFKDIPYLNSSLFEISPLERATIDISGLKDRNKINYHPATVLTDDKKKKRTGEVSTLKYLLDFLDAYDFGQETDNSEIREESKTIINASVLGRIFEKINGYKEGSIFTPGFITMYMCRETIRRAVVRKFNEEYLAYGKSTGIPPFSSAAGAKSIDAGAKSSDGEALSTDGKAKSAGIPPFSSIAGAKSIDAGAKSSDGEALSTDGKAKSAGTGGKSLYDDFNSLKREIDRSPAGRAEANRIINSLKICDPAVGSGHFLVSALNEIIAIKSELGVLNYRDGSRIQEYSIEIENDELVITENETGELFDYHLGDKGGIIPHLQKMQETLFHEKQAIIENCLFGVDINPNSVNICRLRLWIELLKDAYYIPGTMQLETLPNIDINIKQGNSLISRYALDADIKTALKNSRWNVDSYRSAVMTYRNAATKEEKREMESLINTIKNDFVTEISSKDKRVLRKRKLEGDLFNLQNQFNLFGMTDKEKEKWEKDVNKITAEIAKLETEIEEIKNNKIYENAFEWRFEFPEVLDDEGNFMGFDVVIGNPPYIFGGNLGISSQEKILFKEKFNSGSGKINLFTLFIEQGFNVLAKNKLLAFVIPNTFLRVTSYSISRKDIIDNKTILNIYDFGDSVFQDAITTAIVIIVGNTRSELKHSILISSKGTQNRLNQNSLKNNDYVIAINIDQSKSGILNKIVNNSYSLGELCEEMIFGVVITKNIDDVVSNKFKEGWKPFLEGKDIGKYYINFSDKYLNYEPQLLHRPRTKKIFEVNEKILIQRITGGNQPLKATLDTQKFYNKESINNIILKEGSKFKIKAILALINSKLINWFYTNQFTNESNLTVNLSKEYLSKIPICKNLINRQDKFEEKVDQILLAKKENPQADTSVLESEIDRLVYELYGLTEEEIKIVEG